MSNCIQWFALGPCALGPCALWLWEVASVALPFLLLGVADAVGWVRGRKP
jgi:hypothetical protein